jgi:hypothetical protein
MRWWQGGRERIGGDWIGGETEGEKEEEEGREIDV